MRVWTLLLSCLGVAACGGGGGGGGPDARPAVDAAAAIDAGTTAPVAVFTPVAAGSGAAWGTIPYPSDLFLDADGLLTLTALPTGPLPDATSVMLMQEALHTLDGAGVWSSVYFPITGDVDPATLAGNVHLVDLNGALVDLPVDLRYRGDLGAIIAAPVLGTVLRKDSRYAAYVTDGVTGPGGVPLARAAAFAAAADLQTVPTDPGAAAAQASLRPLLQALPAATAARVVTATVFRTERVSDELVAMRDLVAATPPTASFASAWGPSAAELDQIFGVQDPAAVPGMSELAPRNQPHGHVGLVVHGTIQLASFLNAAPGLAGFVASDATGKPLVKGTHAVKFTLILPAQASWANLPVVLYEHGVNRARSDMLVQADLVNARGMALLATDILYHGDRDTMAVDDKNDLTGALVPDGFGDVGGLLPAVRFFQLLPSGGVPAYHPRAMRDNLRQAAIDLCSLVAFVRDGDTAPLAAALALYPGLPADLSFRGDQVGLLAESFGSMIGGVALAVEPGFDPAVLSVAAAGFPYPTLIHSANYSGQFVGVVLAPYDVASRTVLGDPDRGARFEPMVMLWNIALEQGDPVAYAPYVLDGTLRGGAGPNLLMTEVWSDEWVPNDATEHYAGALGVPRMLLAAPAAPPAPGLRYVALPEVPAPVAGNFGGGTTTAALTLWHPAAHAMIRYIDGFWDYEPNFPPFVLRTPRVMITMPAAAVQAMWTSFVADAFAGGGAPAISDPYAP